MIEFPEENAINWWIDYLPRSENSVLKKYLPKVDKDWKIRIMQTISLVHMEYVNGYLDKNVHHIASCIFYRINKAHREIDGNKRSSIIVTYLFYLMNDFALISTDKVRLLAKKIAKSKGRRNQKSWIRKATKVFSVCTVSIKSG